MAPLLTTPLTRRAALGTAVAVLAGGMAPTAGERPREIPLTTTWDKGDVTPSGPVILTMLAATFAPEDAAEWQQLLRDAAELSQQMSIEQIRNEVRRLERHASAD